ncbi:MAG: DeoR family transcriptional regulator [Desulfurococcaceae archaeon]
MSNGSDNFFLSPLQRKYTTYMKQIIALLRQSSPLRIEQVAFSIGVSSETVRRVINSFNPVEVGIKYEKGFLYYLKEKREE